MSPRFVTPTEQDRKLQLSGKEFESRKRPPIANFLPPEGGDQAATILSVGDRSSALGVFIPQSPDVPPHFVTLRPVEPTEGPLFIF